MVIRKIQAAAGTLKQSGQHRGRKGKYESQKTDNQTAQSDHK